MANSNNQSSVSVPDEKLVDEQELQEKPDKEQSVAVKLVPDNGESKMDCDNIRRAFVGMGKEELMKFANDPFWVRTRWILFALFWISWVAMLVGAIAIVIYAPKCSTDSPEVVKLNSVIYELDLRAFEAGNKYARLGYLKGLQNNLDYIQYLGADSILINSLMEGIDGDPETTKDFAKIDSTFGTFEILEHLTKEMKDKGLRLIMSFVPNYSSDSHVWFKNSVAKINPFTDYYVWSKGFFSYEGEHLPPNNWVSVPGNSAWTWVEERREFYLHQFKPHQPDLNFHNPLLVNYFKDLLVTWLNHGLSGFLLKDAKFLMEDPKLENETANQLGTVTHSEYDFFLHHKTSYRPETINLLKQWGEVVKEHSGELYVTDVKPEDKQEMSFLTTHVWKFDVDITALDFQQRVKSNLDSGNPIWQWQCKLTCPSEVISKGILVSFLLLPGTAIISGGEELPWLAGSKSPLKYPLAEGAEKIESWKNQKESDLNMFKNIVMLKNSKTISFGTTSSLVLNGTVFGFSRVLADNPTYVVLVNFGKADKSVSWNIFDELNESSRAEVLHCSQNICSTLSRSLEQSPINMIGKSFLVLEISSPASGATILESL